MHAALVLDPHQVLRALVALGDEEVAHRPGVGQRALALARADIQVDAAPYVRRRFDEPEDLAVPEPERRAEDRRETITSWLAKKGVEAHEASERRPADARPLGTGNRAIPLVHQRLHRALEPVEVCVAHSAADAWIDKRGVFADPFDPRVRDA